MGSVWRTCAAGEVRRGGVGGSWVEWGPLGIQFGLKGVKGKRGGAHLGLFLHRLSATSCQALPHHGRVLANLKKRGGGVGWGGESDVLANIREKEGWGGVGWWRPGWGGGVE